MKLIRKKKKLAGQLWFPKKCCLNYHEIFITINLTYIHYLIELFFLLFLETHVPKMLFELPSNIYTCQSYIYQLSHGTLFFYFFWKHMFQKCCLNYHEIFIHVNLTHIHYRYLIELFFYFFGTVFSIMILKKNQFLENL